MEVPAGASVCGHCRAKLKTSPLLIGCLGLFAFCVLIGVIGNLINPGSPSSPSAPAPAPAVANPDPPGTVNVNGVKTTVEKADSLMRDFMKVGLVTKVSPGNNEVQVSRILWESMTLDQKKGMTIGCAQYFKAHGQSGLATLVDNRTGKKLATNDSWSGAKILGD
jgi:hypothetical protein